MMISGERRNTGTDDLISTCAAGVLVLTLNRPQARNAMSDPMLLALQRELEFAEASSAVRAVMLTGSGGAFCAGGDVKAMGAEGGSSGQGDDFIQWQRRVQRATAGKLYRLPKPSLAVINGAAAGAGLALALACDLRIMSTTSILLPAFASVGLSGDFGIAYLLTRLTTAAKARELLFLNDRIGSAQALDLGLVNWACDPTELTATARSIVDRLAIGPSIAYRYMKENLIRAISTTYEDCMDLEATHHVHCKATTDHREGVTAFAQKRLPAFIGE